MDHIELSGQLSCSCWAVTNLCVQLSFQQPIPSSPACRALLSSSQNRGNWWQMVGQCRKPFSVCRAAKPPSRWLFSCCSSPTMCWVAQVWTLSTASPRAGAHTCSFSLFWFLPSAVDELAGEEKSYEKDGFNAVNRERLVGKYLSPLFFDCSYNNEPWNCQKGMWSF